MTGPSADPFTALRAPVPPIDPDPAFAAELRERLQRAVLAPDRPDQGATMTAVATPADQVRATLTPYIAVPDARRALEFYVDAFGARRRGEPYLMGDGRIGHAELALGNSVLMLADEFPEMGITAPGGRGFTLHVEVTDVDATLARAVERGATLDRAAADHEYGRNGAVIDPFGYRWMVASTGPPTTPPESRHGDVAYLTHAVPDSARARAFYGAVLGWAFSPGSVEDRWQIEGTAPPAGLRGGAAAGIEAAYFVDDLDAALDVVRSLGGTAETPVDRHYGRMAECTDDQGIPFSLLQS